MDFTGIKINQTFVMGKIILSMVTSVYKWTSSLFIASCFFISISSRHDALKPPRWEAAGLEGGHPFHVSTTEINHNAKDKTLEISCRIFTDDFETVLEKVFKTKVDLTHPKDKATTDRIVSDYILKHLQIKADDKAEKISYLGYEIDNDAVSAYLEVDSIASVKKIETTDSILYDQFDDQMSIIHVIVGGNRKSTKLEYPETQAMFSF